MPAPLTSVLLSADARPLATHSGDCKGDTDLIVLIYVSLFSVSTLLNDPEDVDFLL